MELKYVLKGAELVATFPEENGATSVWVKGDRFSICDIREGTTTVHQPLPLVPDLEDRATFAVSSIYPPTDDGYKTVRVAAGIVPEGAPAYDVEYTFPDGHVEKATTTTDLQGRTWWRMKYEYDDGGGNETRKPPIEVSVTLSGSGFGLTLGLGRGHLCPGQPRLLRLAQAASARPPRTRSAYRPPRSRSSSWVPSSTTRPRSRTAIWSASRTVERRCAMVIVVRPSDRSSRADWTARSVPLSRALVASSRTSTRGLRSRVRAMASRCFSPPENRWPREPTIVS